MSGYIATVLYPKTASSTFDMDYYLATHMPLVQKSWAPHGLQKWEIVELGDGPYSVQALLYWDSKDDFTKATGHEVAKTVFGDIPNFSSEQPVLVHGVTRK